MDNEVYDADGTSINYEFRMHDPRIGRFLSIDPLSKKYAWNSPYAFSENRVIDAVELEGLESSITIHFLQKTYTHGFGTVLEVVNTKTIPWYTTKYAKEHLEEGHAQFSGPMGMGTYAFYFDMSSGKSVKKGMLKYAKGRTMEFSEGYKNWIYPRLKGYSDRIDYITSFPIIVPEKAPANDVEDVGDPYTDGNTNPQFSRDYEDGNPDSPETGVWNSIFGADYNEFNDGDTFRVNVELNGASFDNTQVKDTAAPGGVRYVPPAKNKSVGDYPRARKGTLPK